MEQIMYSTIAIIITGLIALLYVQVRQLKQVQNQLHQEQDRNAWRTTRCSKCGEREKEASIRQSARVKDSKRRARQRKAQSPALLSLLVLILMGCSTTPEPRCAVSDLACRVQNLEEQREKHQRCVFVHGADSILCGGSQ